ncbi:MAG: EamA family transporter [Ignavibacteria bacterium]|jgi:transporter family protein|nr:EamA family transporter [Ignavibacteria bacterium]MCU7505178.1 EamA family transporter [Ignavibacteria bacterium]MCU7518387.1 EamA family transporter [Ignavibacteria bacterium]
MWWLYAILSALFAALTTIFGKMGVKDIDSTLATAIRTVVVLILAWTIVFFRSSMQDVTLISRRSFLFLVISGLCTGASWLCYYRALQEGNASSVAAIDKTSLPMIFILSALILSEPLTLKTAVAGILIVAGTFVLLF